MTLPNKWKHSEMFDSIDVRPTDVYVRWRQKIFNKLNLYFNLPVRCILSTPVPLLTPQHCTRKVFSQLPLHLHQTVKSK